MIIRPLTRIALEHVDMMIANVAEFPGRWRSDEVVQMLLELRAEIEHAPGATITVARRGHLRTDPVCVFHQPPRTVWQRRRYNRNRGLACDVCMVTRSRRHPFRSGPSTSATDERR